MASRNSFGTAKKRVPTALLSATSLPRKLSSLGDSVQLKGTYDLVHALSSYYLIVNNILV